MGKSHRAASIILKVTFIMYTVFLLCLVFFRLPAFQGISAAERPVNLIPFKTIVAYLSGDFSGSGALPVRNVLGNIAMFIPLGIYLRIFHKYKSLGTNFLPLLLSAAAIEASQFIFGIGSFDIDDVILNCTGGLIGILGYRAILWLTGDEYKSRSIIAVVSALVGLPVFIVMAAVILYNW